MKELALKYGCNPNQKPSRIYMDDGRELPIEVINGRPGYINFLDAFNSWQLVKELKAATGMPAAASFKHVSPAGAAIGLPLSDTLKKIYFCDDVDFELSPLACAYVRARGADRMCSYGDFVALSDVCDEATALLIKREVSDGVIAPGFTPEAIKVLKEKRKGTYCVIQIDPDYVPAPIEHKQVFGVTFEQGRNEVKLDDPALFEDIPTKNKNFTAEAKRDLIISLITLRQCPKVMNLPFKEKIRRADRDNTINVYISDEWEDVLQDGVWEQFFTEKPEPLTREEKKAWIAQNKGVSLGSDAFFPFGDNIERAHKSGVEYIAEAGGSIRDDNVIDTCDKYGIAMAFTHVRLFHH